MKKSTLLSLATAGAIVATSAFTFAAWDKTTDTKNAALTYRKPVTITETLTAPGTKDYTLGQTAPAVDTNVTFAVSDEDNKVSSLTVTPSVKQGGTDLVSSNKVTVSVKKDGSVLAGNKDTSVSASNVYTITVTPTEDATYDDLNNATLEVTGALE